MDITFHYPPELFALIVDTIPKLCRGKEGLLLFFQGAGVPRDILAKHATLLQSDKGAFKKYVVTREILTVLNEQGERSLGERRELLKRVTEFDDFSVCWEGDQAPARGLVSQIRDLVQVKDSFTRMNQERERERQQNIAAREKLVAEAGRKKAALEDIRQRFFALFRESDPWIRGKAVEGVLNDYFRHSGILISEALTVAGDDSRRVLEQIDGVVQLKSQLFLVEVKWESETLGRDKVASPLVRVFSRGLAGCMIISYSDFSTAAIADCRDALREKVIVLCRMEEVVRVITAETDIATYFEAKIDAAVIHKNPLFLPTV